eukprot:4667383-Pleurochrysis_carterae.AAC.1
MGASFCSSGEGGAAHWRQATDARGQPAPLCLSAAAAQRTRTLRQNLQSSCSTSATSRNRSS